MCLARAVLHYIVQDPSSTIVGPAVQLFPRLLLYAKRWLPYCGRHRTNLSDNIVGAAQLSLHVWLKIATCEERVEGGAKVKQGWWCRDGDDAHAALEKLLLR